MGQNEKIMIQRIQTIYLLFAFITMGILPFVFPLETDAAGKKVFFTEHTIDLVLFGLSAVLSLITIFLFKNRKLQFVLCR